MELANGSHTLSDPSSTDQSSGAERQLGGADQTQGVTVRNSYSFYRMKADTMSASFFGIKVKYN